MIQIRGLHLLGTLDDRDHFILLGFKSLVVCEPAHTFKHTHTHITHPRFCKRSCTACVYVYTADWLTDWMVSSVCMRAALLLLLLFFSLSLTFHFKWSVNFLMLWFLSFQVKRSWNSRFFLLHNTYLFVLPLSLSFSLFLHVYRNYSIYIRFWRFLVELATCCCCNKFWILTATYFMFSSLCLNFFSSPFFLVIDWIRKVNLWKQCTWVDLSAFLHFLILLAGQ